MRALLHPGYRCPAIVQTLPAQSVTRPLFCVFRTNVTGRFGMVTGDFGNVTGHFGNVTERTGRQDWRCA
ncbi:hypothetical protein F0160_37870 [Paraburkholderia sp. JPY303]|nr:hypothetical protein [Paraburkholderia atlantica]